MRNFDTCRANNNGCVLASAVLGVFLSLMLSKGAFALDAMKVGFTAPLSGAATASGKQLVVALQMWRDDVNSKGGLLGRPVELVYYDDESSPARIPPLYRKLIIGDKVDLVIGPYGTNMAAAAMRILLEFNKVTISVLGFGVNRVFSNPKHFAMAPTGADGERAFANSIFELAKSRTLTARTVAIVASDSEFENIFAEAARSVASAFGLQIVYDKRYSKHTSNFTSAMRELQNANADVVFLAPTSGETAELLREINELGLTAKLIGGVIPGLKDIGLKAQLGPLFNGLVTVENFPPALALNFPESSELLSRYRDTLGSSASDSIDTDVVLYAYAAGQVLAQAAEGVKTINSDKLADYIHAHKFETVVGSVQFDADGDWIEARVPVVQFQGVAPNNSIQFSQDGIQPIVWPPQFKSGTLMYPYNCTTRD